MKVATSNVVRATSVFAVASILAITGQGCSFVVTDTNAKQCSTDDDCRSRGPDFVGTFCSQENTCVRSVDYCFTNSECIARTGVGTTICRKDTNRCVDLVSPQCKVYGEPEDIADDNAVIFGIHGIPSWNRQTQACENVTDLIRQDFKATVGGLPPTAASGGKPRPVVWVACDVPIGQQALHKAVSDHLYKDVGVVATNGPFATPDYIIYALQQAQATRAAIFHVDDDNPGYSVPGRENIMFSYGLPLGAGVLGHVNGVTLLENRIRKKGITTPLKVAYIYTQGLRAEDAIEFFQKVRFNGMSAQENGSNYQTFSYPATTDPTYEAALPTTALAVANFAPDIAVFRGTRETSAVADLIEQAQNNLRPGAQKTYYLMSVNGIAGAVQLVAGKEELRKRVIGFAPGNYDQLPQYQGLTLRYNSKYDTGQSQLTPPCNDIAYMMYYAAAAVGNAPLDGIAMGQAIRSRMAVEGTVIDSTQAGILRAYQAIQGGQKLLVQGIASKGLFDPTTGMSTDWHHQYWCVAPFDRAKDPSVSNGILEMNINFSPTPAVVAAESQHTGGIITGDFGGPLPRGCLE